MKFVLVLLLFTEVWPFSQLSTEIISPRRWRYAITTLRALTDFTVTEEGEELDENDLNSMGYDPLEKILGKERVANKVVMDTEMMDDMENSAPSELDIMRDVLGVNAITLLLAFACATTLLANQILGEGWLGKALQGAPSDNSRTTSLGGASSVLSRKIDAAQLPPGYDPAKVPQVPEAVLQDALRRIALEQN